MTSCSWTTATSSLTRAYRYVRQPLACARRWRPLFLPAKLPFHPPLVSFSSGPFRPISRRTTCGERHHHHELLTCTRSIYCALETVDCGCEAAVGRSAQACDTGVNRYVARETRTSSDSRRDLDSRVTTRVDRAQRFFFSFLRISSPHAHTTRARASPLAQHSACPAPRPKCRRPLPWTT